MPEFSDIYPFIAEPSDNQVEFMFMPDRLNVGECEKISLGLDRGTHLSGEFPLEGQEFNIPMTADVILYISMDWKRKGFNYLLEAVAKLPKELRENVRLLVVGKGEPEKYEMSPRKSSRPSASRLRWSATSTRLR